MAHSYVSRGGKFGDEIFAKKQEVAPWQYGDRRGGAEKRCPRFGHGKDGIEGMKPRAKDTTKKIRYTTLWSRNQKPSSESLFPLPRSPFPLPRPSSPVLRRRFQRLVLQWYREHKRALPWRARRDPYRIWISEIMLQQTQVKTVLPYFESFMARFPDIESLAAAEEHEVVALWSGLGYYARARNLHRAARQIQEQGGEFPSGFDAILRLPGVGRYTAGAIASIAFGARKAVVDGNVRRLLQRYFGQGGEEREVWRKAEALLPERQTGDYNQALMEIGATVCLPRRPLCPVCPLVLGCRTRGSRLPRRRKSGAAKSQGMVLLALRRRGRWWLDARDSSQKLLKSLWCFPIEFGKAPIEVLERRMLDRYDVSSGQKAGRFRHSIMNHRFQVWVVTASAKEKPQGTGAWVSARRLGDYPHSSLVEKALALLDWKAEGGRRKAATDS